MKKIFCLLMLLMVFATGANAQTSARRYAQKFEALDKSVLSDVLALTQDLQKAYNPDTPPEMVAAAMIDMTSDYETRQAILQSAASDRQKFLDSDEGAAWIAKRKALRGKIGKTFSGRLRLIRSKISRMNSISPVPASMQRADIAVSSYCSSLNGLLDAFKRVVQRSTTTDSGVTEKASILSQRRRNARMIMGLE